MNPCCPSVWLSTSLSSRPSRQSVMMHYRELQKRNILRCVDCTSITAFCRPRLVWICDDKQGPSSNGWPRTRPDILKYHGGKKKVRTESWIRCGPAVNLCMTLCNHSERNVFLMYWMPMNVSSRCWMDVISYAKLIGQNHSIRIRTGLVRLTMDEWMCSDAALTISDSDACTCTRKYVYFYYTPHLLSITR